MTGFGTALDCVLITEESKKWKRLKTKRSCCLGVTIVVFGCLESLDGYCPVKKMYTTCTCLCVFFNIMHNYSTI